MRRSARAGLLAPSFVVVATLAACDDVSQRNVSVNPPFPVLHSCPYALPRTGEACTRAATAPPCGYSAPVCGAIYAQCIDGRWQLTGGTGEGANGEGGVPSACSELVAGVSGESAFGGEGGAGTGGESSAGQGGAL